MPFCPVGIITHDISELVRTHVEEVKKLMPSIKRAKSDFIVRYLGVSYDDFRKEVWVRCCTGRAWRQNLNKSTSDLLLIFVHIF